MRLDWPRSAGPVSVSGVLRAAPEDFIVEEEFSVDFSDDGEFDWLWIEKRGDNTDYVAKQLAKHAGVGNKAVTYSGLKDRHAVTRQWFCVHLPGKARYDWSSVDGGSWKILRAGRHRQKLRHGSHRSNRFTLRLTDISGDVDTLNTRLAVLHKGVPNYFGEQRFGRDGDNVEQFLSWQGGALKPGRFERGIYISAARSWLFNELLAERIRLGNWSRAVPGDVFSLRDSGSVFTADIDDTILERIEQGDIHPSGPVFGKLGKIAAAGAVAELEESLFDRHVDICAGLTGQGLKMERRALRVLPQSLSWQWSDDNCLVLSFSLPKGCFATAVVRELINY